MPRLKADPEECEGVTVTVPQLSINVGAVHVAMAVHEGPAVNMISVGQFETMGAVLSSTKTVNEHSASLPLLSVPV